MFVKNVVVICALILQNVVIGGKFMADNIISNRIKELREARGLSQADLARELHVTQQTVAHWESGTRDLKTGAIASLAKFFDVTADYLLGLSDYTSSQSADIGAATGLTEDAVKKLKSLKQDLSRSSQNSVLLYCLSKIIENEHLVSLLSETDKYIWFSVVKEKISKLQLSGYVQEKKLDISQDDIQKYGLSALNKNQRNDFKLFQENIYGSYIMYLDNIGYSEYIIQKAAIELVKSIPAKISNDDKYYNTDNVTDYKENYHSPYVREILKDIARAIEESEEN